MERIDLALDHQKAEEIPALDKKMLEHLGEINDKMKRANIDYWTVGGWAIEGLVEVGSKNNAERQHHDIDLLVWEKDKEEIKKLFAQMGFQIKDGRRNEEGEYCMYPHKIVAKKDDVDVDLVFLSSEESNGIVHPAAFEDFSFPKEYLEGDEVNIKGRIYNVPSVELLVALKINSNRKEDIEDVKLLLPKIKDEGKIKAIIDNYSLDYDKFKEEVLMKN